MGTVVINLMDSLYIFKGDSFGIVGFTDSFKVAYQRFLIKTHHKYEANVFYFSFFFLLVAQIGQLYLNYIVNEMLTVFYVAT